MSLFDKLKREKLLSTSLMVFTLSIGILIGTLINTGVNAAKGQAAAPDATPLVTPAATKLPNEFSEIAKKVDPSVVNITSDYTPKGSARSSKRRAPVEEDEEEGGGGSGTDPNELFRRFFGGGNSPFGGGSPRQQMPRGEATGSGFIVDKNGYIITNNHVIDKAETIKVKLHGEKTEFKAKVIGVDWESDLAVLKIDAGRPLPAVKIANSDGVEVGDWAVAIGSPFGLAATVTAGIVSATGRDIAGAEQFQRFIQTDAAINPGNSGGPLLNIKGEVIGVNTAIATQSGGYQGIGFALPVNTAVRVYNSVIQNGRVLRGSIGIGWDKVDKPELLKAAGLNGGVVISNITKGGPAEKAGMKVEDIIVAMNGKPIKDGDELLSRVSETPVGSSTNITVDREGKKLDLKVKVEDRDEVFKDDPRWARRRKETEVEPKVEGTSAKFGIKIREVSEAERADMKLDDKRGVTVTYVEPGSFAEEIGLQDKDVIVSINRQPVFSADDVRKLQGNLKPGGAVAFRVMRPIPVGGTGSKRAVQWQSFYAAGTLPTGQ
jgi:serine protease Do